MKCPGQDSRYWKKDAISEVRCPECGSQVEFFKDDPSRICSNCGHKLANPNIDFGCAAYCKFSGQCIDSLPMEAAEEIPLKDRVALEMKRYFGKDFKRIGHALDVAHYAEKTGVKEGADISVVLCSAYLHDIGIHKAKEKYNSTAPKFQEKEGPEIAEAILSKLGASSDIISKVCDITGHHHHPRPNETIEFKALYDADRIANLKKNLENKKTDKDKILEIIEKQFLTKSGKERAIQVLIK